MPAHKPRRPPDPFARENLPPRSAWPERSFDLPELAFPARMNCAVELLDRAVAERGWGERTAIRSPRGSLTYRELLALADRIAHVLVDEMELAPGERVLLHGPNCPMVAACWFAIVKAGGIAVATMPQLRSGELATIVELAQVTLVLADASLAGEVEATRAACPALRDVAYFHAQERPDGLEARAAGHPAEFTGYDSAADDVCLIAFTSGTTGKPKGTLHFHEDVMAVCACFPPHVLKPTADDLFCGTPPLAFTFGLGGLLLFPLAAGASTLLLEKATPESLLAAIAEHRATVVFTAPTFYRMMTPLVPRFDLTCLRKCVSAGEPLPVATREAWQAATGLVLIDGIGSTELLHIFISATEEETRPGATGRPIPGYQAAILDDDGHPVPPGTVGRLAVKGPTGCRYLADERQALYVQDGWNFTGDAYRMDEDGYFHFQARTDDLILSAGYNIAAPEVENALLAHPAVAECAVVGLPDADRGQVVTAFVVLHGGHQAGAGLTAELQDWTKRQIAPYKYPRAVHFRTALPRTPSGKLQRFRLRDEAAG